MGGRISGAWLRATTGLSASTSGVADVRYSSDEAPAAELVTILLGSIVARALPGASSGRPQLLERNKRVLLGDFQE